MRVASACYPARVALRVSAVTVVSGHPMITLLVTENEGGTTVFGWASSLASLTVRLSPYRTRNALKLTLRLALPIVNEDCPLRPTLPMQSQSLRLVATTRHRHDRPRSRQPSALFNTQVVRYAVQLTMLDAQSSRRRLNMPA